MNKRSKQDSLPASARAGGRVSSPPLGEGLGVGFPASGRSGEADSGIGLRVVETAADSHRPVVSYPALSLIGWLFALMLLFVGAHVIAFEACVRLVEAGLITAAVTRAVLEIRDRGMNVLRPSPVGMLIGAQAVITVLAALTGYRHELAEPSPYRNIVYGGTTFGPIQLAIDQVAAFAAFFLLARAGNMRPHRAQPGVENAGLAVNGKPLRGNIQESASRTDKPNCVSGRSNVPDGQSVNPNPGVYSGVWSGFQTAAPIAACCVGLLGAIQIACTHEAGARADAGFANTNLLASYLAMSWPLLAAQACWNGSPPSAGADRTRITMTAGAILLLGVLWFTGSRGAFIGAALSALAIATAYAVRRMPRIRLGLLAAACALCLLAAAAVVGRHADTLGGISHSVSDRQRLVAWRAGAMIADEHPLLGVGLGGFPAAMSELRLWEPNPVTPSGLPAVPALHLHAHNIFLQYAAERGVPGLIVLIVLVGALLARTTSLILRRDEPVDGFAIGAAAGLLGLLAQNLFDYTLWYAPVILFAWCLAGVIAPKASSAPQNKPAPNLELVSD